MLHLPQFEELHIGIALENPLLSPAGMALVLFTAQVRKEMFRDSSTPGRGFYHGLLVLRVCVTIDAHHRDMPTLDHVATLVAVELQHTCVFHSEKVALET